MSRQALFRIEAVAHRRSTWLGDIVIARAPSAAMLAWLAVAVATALALFLYQGEYTRKARVTGYVVPEQGLVKVVAHQTGTVADLRVQEGQRVQRGDVLFVVSTERSSAHGATQGEIAKQLAFRRESLGQEKEKLHRLYAAMAASARARLARIDEEGAHLDRGRELQRERLRIAQSAVERSARLLRESFVSESVVQEKHGEVLDHQNRLREFERGRMVLEREALALRSEVASHAIREHNEVAAIDRSVAEIAAALVENEARREGLVLAPESGVVTAIVATRGKSVGPGQPAMSLIPSAARLVADLYVPSRAVGFVRVGGRAQLHYQAFPHQKFGSHAGRVTKVSRTSVAASELPFPPPAAEAYYIVSIVPDTATVLAYGKHEPLQVGMQLDADLWLDHRTLFEWMLEPLYGVLGRV